LSAKSLIFLFSGQIDYCEGQLGTAAFPAESVGNLSPRAIPRVTLSDRA